MCAHSNLVDERANVCNSILHIARGVFRFYLLSVCVTVPWWVRARYALLMASACIKLLLFMQIMNYMVILEEPSICYFSSAPFPSPPPLRYMAALTFEIIRPYRMFVCVCIYIYYREHAIVGGKNIFIVCHSQRIHVLCIQICSIREYNTSCTTLNIDFDTRAARSDGRNELHSIFAARNRKKTSKRFQRCTYTDYSIHMYMHQQESTTILCIARS